MKKFLAGFAAKIFIILIAVGAVVVVNGSTFRSSEDLAGFAADVFERIEHFADRQPEVSGKADLISAKADVLKPDQHEIVAASVRVPPEVPQRCTRPVAGGNSVVVGDNIQVRFYETDLAALRSVGGMSRRSAFERLDLSDGYEVGPDGTISMPLLGRIKVLGYSLACVEPIIARAAFDYSPNDVTISATFNRRPAVTALGALRAPGRYEFFPGMTVEQLLSLAGAIVESPTEATLVSNAPYLEARQVELEAALTSNLLKYARIEAAIGGQKELALSNEQMVAAEGILGAKRIEAEKAALSASVEMHNSSLQQMRLEKDQAEKMIAAQRKKLTLVQYQLGTLTKRHSDLVVLRGRGVVQENTVASSESVKMDMQRTMLETQSALLDLEARVQRLTSEIEARTASYRQQLALELRNVSEEGNGLQSQLQTVAMQLNPKRSAEENTYLAVVIERAGTNGTKTIEAMPETTILPGDVVTTVMKRGLPKERYALSATEVSLTQKVVD